MDAVASLYGRNCLTDIIAATAAEIFIPLCVGGGLRSLDDIKEVLRAGADKVCLNTAAVKRPQLISEAARRFGSSTIVISIEAIRQPTGTWHHFTDYGREETGLDAVAWGLRAAELGAGELLVTSIDREGTGKGFDLELVRAIASKVDIPVIAAGGAGRVEHASQVVDEGLADAVCLASLLHYGLVGEMTCDQTRFASEGNIEYLKTGRAFGAITGASLARVKEHLDQRGISCRPAGGEKAHAC
jgi:cyclase